MKEQIHFKINRNLKAKLKKEAKKNKTTVTEILTNLIIKKYLKN